MATYREGYVPKPSRLNTPNTPTAPDSSKAPIPRSRASLSDSERQIVSATSKATLPSEMGNFSSGSPDAGAPAYPVYKKGSAQATDFNSAFGSARKAGKSEFEWEGRKYNTKKA